MTETFAGEFTEKLTERLTDESVGEFQVFEFDDFGFAPDSDENEMEGQQTDYLSPVPGAEYAPPHLVAADLPVEERIAALFRGMPGQKNRLLEAIRICSTPKSLAQVEQELTAAYPSDVSVYNAARVVALLEEAGALCGEESGRDEEVSGVAALGAAGVATAADGGVAGAVGGAADASGGAKASAEPGASSAEAAEVPSTSSSSPQNDAAECLVVTPPKPRVFLATAAGQQVVDAKSGTQPVIDIIQKEAHYLPVYAQVLSLVAKDGGCSAKDLDKAVNTHPLLAEPRRYSGYFVKRLEDVDALRWANAWVITDTGRAVLASGALDEHPTLASGELDN